MGRSFITLRFLGALVGLSTLMEFRLSMTLLLLVFVVVVVDDDDVSFVFEFFLGRPTGLFFLGVVVVVVADVLVFPEAALLEDIVDE